MYRSIVLSYFIRRLKPYAKKHPDLRDAILHALQHFDTRQHDCIGGSVYKVRLKMKSLARGKSASARMLVLVMEIEHFLVPITIYFKSDRETLTKKEINHHLQEVLIELRMNQS